MTGFTEQLDATTEKYLVHFGKTAGALKEICADIGIPLDAAGVNAVAFTTYKATKDALHARPTQAQAVPAANGEEEVAVVVPKCPRCGGAMWDNRKDKKNPKAPDFKCKDKNCMDEKGFGTALWLKDLGKKQPPQKKAAPSNDFREAPAAPEPFDLF